MMHHALIKGTVLECDVPCYDLHYHSDKIPPLSQEDILTSEFLHICWTTLQHDQVQIHLNN